MQLLMKNRTRYYGRGFCGNVEMESIVKCALTSWAEYRPINAYNKRFLQISGFSALVYQNERLLLARFSPASIEHSTGWYEQFPDVIYHSLASRRLHLGSRDFMRGPVLRGDSIHEIHQRFANAGMTAPGR